MFKKCSNITRCIDDSNATIYEYCFDTNVGFSLVVFRNLYIRIVFLSNRNMENSSRILKNLENDINEVLQPSQRETINENETDLIRRRRLERLGTSTPSSPMTTTEIHEDNSNNNV